jgi:CelD/BcsL family acetyltransferase involved in cellulose biosynthesis
LSVTAKILTTLEEAEEVASAWDELATNSGAPGTATPGYALTWWRHCGRGRLLVAVAYDGTSLIALAPLHEQRISGLNVIRLLGHGLGAVSEVLVAPGRDDGAEAIWDILAESRRRVLELVEYRYGGAALLALRRSTAWDSELKIRDVCPVIAVGNSLKEVLSGGSHRRLRQTLNRADRFLENEGLTHEAEVVTKWERLQEVLDDAVIVFDEAERHNPRLNYLGPQWREFTLDLLRRQANEGRLAVFLGYISGRPVSVAIILRAGVTLGYWGSRFDPAFSRFSPGHLLLRFIIDYASNDPGLHEVDLLLGDQPYKRQWATSTYDTLSVVAASPRLLPAAKLILNARLHLYDFYRRISKR